MGVDELRHLWEARGCGGCSGEGLHGDEGEMGKVGHEGKVYSTSIGVQIDVNRVEYRMYQCDEYGRPLDAQFYGRASGSESYHSNEGKVDSIEGGGYGCSMATLHSARKLRMQVYAQIFELCVELARKAYDLSYEEDVGKITKYDWALADKYGFQGRAALQE